MIDREPLDRTTEQIIADVVLSERLAVTMYGAIHRAQWNGQRNMRALVVDEKVLVSGRVPRRMASWNAR